MQPRMTNHFITRMHERGISLDDVKKCLRSPDGTSDAGDGKIEAHKSLDGGKTITVIYFKLTRTADELVLVTAYYSL